MPERHALLIQLRIDAEILVLGEAESYGGSLAGAEAVIRYDLRPALLGEDPFRV